VTVDIVTTGFFETLGVQPTHGRDFTMEEERPGTPARSVIVSYSPGMWVLRAAAKMFLTLVCSETAKPRRLVGSNRLE
jgi:hypothetical protein